ncbi:hypothetical protein [Stenotrophomonas indicatrix]|jgi:hypothetical protein|uniref:Transposase n=1 Tax=Stenotrophomonas indicatrix TaxID=2045451 RepID=A0ABT8QDW9_9GAMM|nr:hypothetical protein [Stenotrophomonas indicatrix]MDN8662560.1 hypothetical protein [Stenotrophomonas indicatrix]MDN8670024.1 hypothetical protein [Stenotrophomonas indicatrix]
MWIDETVFGIDDMGTVKHLRWHSPPPKEVLLPPFNSPEAYHSNFVRQAGRETGINPGSQAAL